MPCRLHIPHRLHQSGHTPKTGTPTGAAFGAGAGAGFGAACFAGAAFAAGAAAGFFAAGAGVFFEGLEELVMVLALESIVAVQRKIVL